MRLVVKIGSAMVTDEERGLNVDGLKDWASQIAFLVQQGAQVVLVSSGAVAQGMNRLGLNKRPDKLAEVQALAALGQMGLVQAYETTFNEFDIKTAQVLLTHDVFKNRERYLNARQTLRTLLNLGIVPIVNENDAVADEEIKFGDNDTLGALVTNLVEADQLIILTDQQGVFDDNPRENPEAKLIKTATAGEAKLYEVASSKGGALGRGGMYTKVRAAEAAARSGANTVIASGLELNVLLRLFEGEAIGTWIDAGQSKTTARKQWLADQLHVQGKMIVDSGAAKVLRAGASLLPVGVIAIEGDFHRGDLVACLDEQGREVARGLSNYHANEASKLLGVRGDKITKILGYGGAEELIHRDNLIVP